MYGWSKVLVFGYTDQGSATLIYRYREKKLRRDKLSRQFFVRNLSNLVVILVEILVAKAIPVKKLK